MPAFTQRRQILQDILNDAREATGPRAVLTERCDCWIRGEILYYRDGRKPMTEPYLQIRLPATAHRMAVDNEKLYVWVGDSQLLAFSFSESGGYEPLFPAGKQRLRRHRRGTYESSVRRLRQCSRDLQLHGQWHRADIDHVDPHESDLCRGGLARWHQALRAA